MRVSGMPYTVIRPVALRNEPRGLRGVTFATMGIMTSATSPAQMPPPL